MAHANKANNDNAEDQVVLPIAEPDPEAERIRMLQPEPDPEAERIRMCTVLQ